MAETNQTWWDSLSHGGLLIAPKQLAAYFPDRAQPLNDWTVEQLRRQLSRFDAAKRIDERRALLPDLLTIVLEKVCGLTAEYGTWQKDLGSEWSRTMITGETMKPRRVWTHPSGVAFPVFVADDDRLGIGKGIRAVSRVLEWLRRGSERVALLTNGRQWRLIYAGLDHDAWAQWETEQWLAEGQPGPQVEALQILLSPAALLAPKSGEPSPLLAAIDDTRKGQAEISAELGERVRKAVELLIQAHATAVDEKGGELAKNDTYLAAVRMVMRMVVILFAEARPNLLPVDQRVYSESYGLQGLREIMRRSAGGRRERLRSRHGAWPRILALFRLVYEGCPHKSLSVPKYGGELFRPGTVDRDGVSRAVHLFETACFEHEVSDDVVFEMLELITTTHVRVRQGNATRVTRTPVNFADLSTEYIGMLYEGLLGYELRRVEEADEAIVFLNLGDQPALPLKRLEAMNEKTLENLVEKFKKKVTAVTVSEDEAEEEDDEESEDEAAEEENAEEVAADETPEEVGPVIDCRQVIRDRAVDWAKRAVVAGKLVSKPRSQTVQARAEHEAKVGEKAKQITGAAYLPGQYFLIRSSGTRKGSGTFYTRPGLAIPTTHRTLRPLAYIAPIGEDGQPNELAPATEWTPRKPEEILALKVCDPACGSASFLVATLRFLTDALYVSLHHHGRIQQHGEGALVTLAEGKEGTGVLAEETLPCRPDDPAFEPRLRARLKRYVVERCVYGVDHDRLAIELARMALWIETMDRELPFEFLDHKVRHGNSLVGAWFDQFAMYPILAWDREAGDAKHERFVHHKHTRLSTRGKSKGKESTSGDPWNVALKDFYANTAKPRYRDWLDGKVGLWDQVRPDDAKKQHEEAVRLFEQLHELPVQDSEARAEFYRKKIAGSESYKKLKEAFDTWCAIWFWPPDKLQFAPVATGAVDAANLRDIVARVSRERAFFHWELEFPDVFRAVGAGFDAILGNPPWEISKPSSKEFFSRIDPLYRSYGKQEALDKQREYFERSADDEREWIRYSDFFKAMSNWASRAASALGDGAAGGEFLTFSRSPRENEQYQAVIELRRTKGDGFADSPHPFRYQGSADTNLYKMFLEVAHALVRYGGRFGMIVPSGIYTDTGAGQLRKLFLDNCSWEWIYGFENRQLLFQIASSIKFCICVLQRGGATAQIRCAFMKQQPDDWTTDSPLAVRYTRDMVSILSPSRLSVVEFGDERDIDILLRMYNAGLTVGSNPLASVKLSRELDMANDSHLFLNRVRAERGEIIRRGDNIWIAPDKSLLLPLYQGRMLWQYEWAAAAYVSGTGMKSTWISGNGDVLLPQFLIRKEDAPTVTHAYRLLVRYVTKAVNERTVVAAVCPSFPTGHTVAVVVPEDATISNLFVLAAIFNSFPFDFAARLRFSGGMGVGALDNSKFAEYPMPRITTSARGQLARLSAALGCTSELFDSAADELRQCGVTVEPNKDGSTRARIKAVIHALVADLYGLSSDQFRWILRDCDRSSSDLSRSSVRRCLPQRGFWRVDEAVIPEERETNLSLEAFRDLCELKQGDAPEAYRDFVRKRLPELRSEPNLRTQRQRDD